MEFEFITDFGGRQRPIGYRLTADKDVRITSIAGYAVKRDGSPITRSDSVMKRLRRKARIDYMSNMRERAGV